MYINMNNVVEKHFNISITPAKPGRVASQMYEELDGAVSALGVRLRRFSDIGQSWGDQNFEYTLFRASEGTLSH
jgi:hypothetical protein